MGSDASRRFAKAELRRSGSREAAAARVGPLNEAARLVSFLRATLVELDEATASFLENIREQDALEASAQRDPDRERELFEAGGRLAGVVHLPSRRSMRWRGSCSTRSRSLSTATPKSPIGSPPASWRARRS